MNTSLGIMITTVENRRKALTWNIKHLLKYIDIPFTLYIYNDGGSPLSDYLVNLFKRQDYPHLFLEIFNDNKEITPMRVGCGGGRHYLFEVAKLKHEIIISLDDDIQITKGWFQAIKKAIDEYPNYSVFAGVLKGADNRIQVAGSRMIITENQLIRKEIRSITGKYNIADWGPLGCLVLCRKALHPEIKIPNLFVREDAAFFLTLKKMGINETIVAHEAIAIHRSIHVPSSNLRIPEKMQAAKEYYKKHHNIKIK